MLAYISTLCRPAVILGMIGCGAVLLAGCGGSDSPEQPISEANADANADASFRTGHEC